jgi:tetratricopeptide (TPR) repeat protein
MENLGITYSDQRRYAEAGELQEKALHRSRRNLGENHPSTLNTMVNLGVTYRQQVRLTDAVELLSRTMQAHARLQLGGDGMAETMADLGVAYLYLG